MKKLFFATLMVVSLLLANLATASEEGQELNTRKGFLIGFGGSGGGEFNELNNGYGGMEFRIGTGINENFLVYVQSDFLMTHDKDADLDTSFADLLIKAQAIFNNGMYAGIGVGFTTIEIDLGDGFNYEEGGWSFNTAIGYEIRIKKSFAISPEVNLTYRGIDGFSFPTVGGTLHLGWYF
jgi:hypothetical protein